MSGGRADAQHRVTNLSREHLGRVQRENCVHRCDAESAHHSESEQNVLALFRDEQDEEEERTGHDEQRELRHPPRRKFQHEDRHDVAENVDGAGESCPEVNVRFEVGSVECQHVIRQ